MNEPRGTTFDSSSQGILQALEGLLLGNGLKDGSWADCRRCLRILVWRLLIFRLRKRPQVWPKDNTRPSPFNRC